MIISSQAWIHHRPVEIDNCAQSPLTLRVKRPYGTPGLVNKRLRHSAQLLQHVIAWLARNSPSWWDDLWLVDSTPVECGRSRQTAQRSDLGGWAEYGYCASHSRYFWGLRLHLVATPSGLPITFALAGAKADERDICLDMLTHAQIGREGQTLTNPRSEVPAPPDSRT